MKSIVLRKNKSSWFRCQTYSVPFEAVQVLLGCRLFLMVNMPCPRIPGRRKVLALTRVYVDFCLVNSIILSHLQLSLTAYCLVHSVLDLCDYPRPTQSFLPSGWPALLERDLHPLNMRPYLAAPPPIGFLFLG